VPPCIPSERTFFQGTAGLTGLLLLLCHLQLVVLVHELGMGVLHLGLQLIHLTRRGERGIRVKMCAWCEG
jgi:hypothetical protein